MKLFVIFLAIFALSLLLGGVLPHLLRGQFYPLRPLGTLPVQVSAAELDMPAIPQAGVIDLPLADTSAEVAELPTLESFIREVTIGEPDQLTGVYVPSLFALPVVQQPFNDPEYVSPDSEVVTEFSLPARHGSTGLLAHNYLSGRRFYELVPGQVVVLVYGDGSTESYQIDRISQYQALSPSNPFSHFINVADAQRRVLTSKELFDIIYTKPGELTFQTCIDAFGETSWGRTFITAVRIQDMGSLPEVGQFVSQN